MGGRESLVGFTSVGKKSYVTMNCWSYCDAVTVIVGSENEAGADAMTEMIVNTD